MHDHQPAEKWHETRSRTSPRCWDCRWERFNRERDLFYQYNGRNPITNYKFSAMTTQRPKTAIIIDDMINSGDYRNPNRLIASGGI